MNFTHLKDIYLFHLPAFDGSSGLKSQCVCVSVILSTLNNSVSRFWPSVGSKSLREPLGNLFNGGPPQYQPSQCYRIFQAAQSHPQTPSPQEARHEVHTSNPSII